MAVATLDEISGGRAQLGLGTSSPSLIRDQMGIGVGRSVEVMREATEITRGLLAGEVVSYPGSRFRYEGAVLEARAVQSRVPVIFAAMGPKMLRLAGRMADGVLLNVGASTEYVRWAVREIRAGAREAGRDPGEVTVAAWMSVYLSGGTETRRRAREWLATMLSIPRQGELLLEHAGLDTSILARIRSHYHAYPHGGDLQAAAQHVPDEAVERLALIGDGEVVRRRLEEYRTAGVQVAVMGISALRKVM
jgi:5,10-methylenetetrahydromethanopterin reductase